MEIEKPELKGEMLNFFNSIPIYIDPYMDSSKFYIGGKQGSNQKYVLMGKETFDELDKTLNEEFYINEDRFKKLKEILDGIK